VVTPVTLVVAGVTAIALLTAWALVLLSSGPGSDEAILACSYRAPVPLWMVLSAATCVSELVAVRVRHARGVEELTLLDPMVVLNVLFLPARQALLVTVVGLVGAYGLRRRSPVKAIFNTATYATGTAVLIGLAHITAGPGPLAVGARLIPAILLGTTGFVVTNLVAMSMLFNTLGVGTVRSLLRADLKLAVFTVATTLAFTATAATIAVNTPGYLPFTILPAAAVNYAYRAIATEQEERHRNAQVLVFTQTLASSPQRDLAITAFVHLAREGFTADEVLIGSPDEVLISSPDEQPDQTRRRLLAGAEGGPELVAPQTLPEGWVSGIVAPLEANGRVLGAVAVGRRTRPAFRPADLTVVTSLVSALAAALDGARHLDELVTETSKLRAVLEQSSDGILVLDGAGTVELWNPAMERLTGRPEPDAVRRPLSGLLPTVDLDGRPADVLGWIRSRLSPQTPQAVVDAEILRGDGERRSVRYAHAAVFDEQGELLRDVVNVHDLTQERRVERLKNDFVATVSHELRTPITPLKGYAELLLRRWDDLPEEKRTRALTSIVDRAAHLARLVEDLLLAAKISDGQEPARAVHPDTVDLVALTARAMEDFADAADRLHLARPDDPVTATADSARTIQILTNLVSNALKYSDPGAPVELRVEAGDGQCRVTVRDRGRGLPQDELERIFEKFHRVEDPMVMKTGGTGLGLYIARHLARAMSGDLTVRSRLGEGSEFTLTLPPPPQA
jgi:PAS domain S-box-containing protein